MATKAKTTAEPEVEATAVTPEDFAAANDAATAAQLNYRLLADYIQQAAMGRMTLEDFEAETTRLSAEADTALATLMGYLSPPPPEEEIISLSQRPGGARMPEVKPVPVEEPPPAAA